MWTPGLKTEVGWGGVRKIAVFIDKAESVPKRFYRQNFILVSHYMRLRLPVDSDRVSQTKSRQSKSPSLIQVVQSEKLKLALEVGDGDLELSSLALFSS